MAEDTLWIPRATSGFALGKESVLMLDRRSLAVETLEPLTAAVFSRCQAARPLHDHVAEAWTSGVSPSATAIADAIDYLVSRGLLREMARPARVEGPQRSQAIETVAIVTADRPRAVARALQGLGHQRRRGIGALVIDGSRTNAGHTRAATASKDGTPGLRTHYIGVSQTALLRQHLTSCGIPAAVTEYSLTPGDIGSGRNIAVLLTAGRPLIMQDDDVIATTWTEGDADTGAVALAGHADLRRWRFFGDRDAVRAALRDLESGADIADAHGAVLGLSLADVVGCRDANVSYIDACGHIVAALNDAAARKVRVTFAGLAGDAARYCSHGPLFASSPTRRQFWSDEAAFASATSSREVTAVATRVIVGHDPACVAYCMGVDNTALVPPFMPMGRNEDGVWGATLALIAPGALFAHLPWGVWHESDRPAQYENLMPSARQSRLADFLLFVVTRLAPTTLATDPADRLRHLGRLFDDMAMLPAEDFRALVAESKLSTLSQELTRASSAAADPACPVYWRRALEDYQRVCRKSVTRPAFFLPIEFHDGDLDAGFAEMQQFVARFGELLCWWPEMWSAAKSLDWEQLTAA
ncbi:MAG: hypothetical protein ABS36_16980 [Acidobacteria bacterium SCN 69-37]|nr:MAG: hypothetical protein ABS36_16980 [Acidobacteria bacterium SCN 69-37]